MFRLLTYLLFVLPVCSMDSVPSNLVDLPYSYNFSSISDSESTDEERPLLEGKNSQETNQIFADSVFIPIDSSPASTSTTDLLTPYSNRHPSGLPKDMFWFIISLCEKKDILNLCETSTHFRDQLRKLIPILTPLPERPSSVQILNFLQEIEWWKEGHKQLGKHVPNVTDILTAFPRYWEELDRLSLAQTYVQFSPHFWWHGGSKRVDLIRDYYGIDAPNWDWCKLPLYTISSILRDPYGLHMTCTGAALLTAIGGWYIYMNHLSHDEQVRFATEEFNRATAQANADYAQALQKNLIYAQSEAYYSTAFPNVTINTDREQFRDMGECFSLICNTPSICLDTRSLCQPEIIVNQTSADFFTNAQKLFGNVLSVEDLKKYVINLFNQTCKLDWSSNWQHDPFYYSYSYNIRHKNQWFIFDMYDIEKLHICNDNHEEWRRCFIGKKSGETTLFSFDLMSYDPHCIAKHLTSLPNVPPIPYIHERALAWSLGIGGTWLSFIVFLILGWCMGV